MAKFEIRGKFEQAEDSKYYIEADDFMAALEAVREKSPVIIEALLQNGTLKFQMLEFRELKELPLSPAVLTFEEE